MVFLNHDSWRGMNTTTQYQVVFSGKTREGFERKQVALTLAQKLRLNGEQVKRLFDGADHTIKRTATESEAQKVVEKLAQMGAVARVDKPPAAKETTPPPPVSLDKPPLPITPLENDALFKPLLYLVVGVEALLVGFYFFLLLGMLYLNFFTLWAEPGSDYPLLMLLFQLLSIPPLTLLLLLLAKPLLSLRSRRHRGILAHEEQEPDLQMFVQEICERLEIPVPTEIRFSNDVAILMHHRGLQGLWKNETILTIGVPLLAVLKTNQLAALITRELRCFHPREAPIAGFLLMAVNRWLHASLHHEDSFDLGLKRWLEHGRLSSGPVENLQRLCAFSRRMLIPRHYFSTLIGRRLAHTIVARADDEACAIPGHEGFSQALEQQRLIDHTVRDLTPKLQKQWDEKGVLPDDMVQLILLRARQFPASIHGHLRLTQEQKKAAENDIIPADSQRIDRLQSGDCPVGYACVSPAQTLVRHFVKLASSMTVRYYHNRLNVPITPNKLIHPLVKGSVEEQLNTVLKDYFNGVLHLMEPLNLLKLTDDIPDHETARKNWYSARQRIEADTAQARHDFTLNTTMEKQITDNSMREVLYRAELWRAIGESKPKKGDLEAFLQQCRDMEGEYEKSLKKIALHQSFYAQRLATALMLLRPPEEEEDNDKRYMEMVMLLTVSSRIEGVLPMLRELKLNTSLLNILLSYLNSDRASSLKDLIDEKAADIRQTITSIKLALKDVPTPFPTPRGGKVLMDYLLLESYTKQTAEGDFDRGNDIVNRLALVQQRILVKLIEMASEAEQGLS